MYSRILNSPPLVCSDAKKKLISNCVYLALRVLCRCFIIADRKQAMPTIREKI
jgi:hypothetical protein